MLETRINVKILNDKATMPSRGSSKAAGYDLYAALDDEIWIPPHSTRKIGTGLAFELPDNTFGAIFARSGLATKVGARPANCVGVIDADYRGQCIVPLHNDTDIPICIKPNERIAQLILLPFLPMSLNVVDELSDTERGDGGFGSTGK